VRKRDTKHKITAEPFPFGANNEKEEKKVISHIPGGEDEGGDTLVQPTAEPRRVSDILLQAGAVWELPPL